MTPGSRGFSVFAHLLFQIFGKLYIFNRPCVSRAVLQVTWMFQIFLTLRYPFFSCLVYFLCAILLMSIFLSLMMGPRAWPNINLFYYNLEVVACISYWKLSSYFLLVTCNFLIVFRGRCMNCPISKELGTYNFFNFLWTFLKCWKHFFLFSSYY